MSEKKKLNYKSSTQQNLYQAINPNLEVGEGGYVWFNSGIYDRDNAYPNKLIDMYHNASAVHSNFINLKANLIYGSGLIPLESNDQSVIEFLESTNRAGQTMNDIYKKMTFDMAIFEAAALQVIYNSEGKIVEVYHTSPANLRASIPNEFGYSDYWYYSNRWGIIPNKRSRKQQNLLSDAVKIPTFNYENGAKDKRQILYIKKYSPSSDDVYSIPSYNSILSWVQTDYELGQFHLNKIQNSLSPSGIVSLKGDPSDEERDEFVRNFKLKHTGSDNAGKLLFMWSDGENQTPEFIRLEQDPNKGLYEELQALVTERIAIGHGGNLELAGSDSKGVSLGGDSNKLNTSRAYYIDTVTRPMAELILNEINKLLKKNGIGQVKIENKAINAEATSQADTDQTDTNNNTDDVQPEQPVEQKILNDKLAGLTGKEFINLMRYIRNIKSGKITKAAGELLLSQSYGLDNDTIEALLCDEELEENLNKN